jgi:ABC-type Fe3+/spermidine/putrescine transport system ATPase subunit
MTEAQGLSCRLKATYPDFSLDVSFSVRRGELACIIGPSGCGKTTTLQLLSGLLTPDDGSSIMLEGKDILNLPADKRQIALVFQDYALFPQMTVEENIAYPMKLKKKSKAERTASVNSLLELVSLPEFQRRKPSQLSGGERQRVALARALASDPKMLLLDEPLSALDTKLRKHLREEIRRIHDETGVTMVYVTHDQNEAMAIADSIIVMDRGHIEQIACAEELYRHPKTLFAASFMGEGNILPYSIITQTLASEGNEYVMFRPRSGEQKIFFRPEQVTIQSDALLPLPEFLPHLEFKDAKLLSCVFQGSCYQLTYRWSEYTIIVQTDKRPKGLSAILGVRLLDILQFLDGKAVPL